MKSEIYVRRLDSVVKWISSDITRSCHLSIIITSPSKNAAKIKRDNVNKSETSCTSYRVNRYDNKKG